MAEVVMGVMGKKVCILTTVHPPFDTRIFHKQAKTLVRAGYDVTLIAQHDKNEIVDGVKVIALPRPRNRLQRMVGLTSKTFLLALQQRAGIYYFHDPELLPASILLKLFTHAKVVYDVHEDVPKDILIKDWISSLLKIPLAWVVNFIEKQVARHLDAIVTATEDIACSFKKPKPIVIHNYPDLTKLPEMERPPGDEDEFVLIYVGGIDRLRGAVETVRALEYLPADLKVRLELIGRFEPPSLETELQVLPGYQRVSFIGWLPWESALSHVQDAQVGLALLHPGPTYTDSLPIKLFEYMAASLPVVASNFPLWRDIIESSRCGLTVDPLNPQGIAQAVEYLVTHPEEAREMGENGRQAVLEKYNWDTEAKKLLNLYTRLTRG